MRHAYCRARDQAIQKQRCDRGRDACVFQGRNRSDSTKRSRQIDASRRCSPRSPFQPRGESAGTARISMQWERYRAVLGYLPQQFGYYPSYTPRAFLRYVGALQRMDKRDIARRADELLELVGLDDAADRRMREFSGGMIQRIGIATALLADPQVLILMSPLQGSIHANACASATSSMGLRKSARWFCRRTSCRISRLSPARSHSSKAAVFRRIRVAPSSAPSSLE